MTFLNYQQLTKSGLYYALDTDVVDLSTVADLGVALDVVYVDIDAKEYRHVAYDVTTPDVEGHDGTYFDLYSEPSYVYMGPIEFPKISGPDIRQAVDALEPVEYEDPPADEMSPFNHIDWVNTAPALVRVGNATQSPPPLVKVAPPLARV